MALIERNNDPITEEFEKLEFLPESPTDGSSDTDDTAEIVFTPESELAGEPPVSFRTMETADQNAEIDALPEGEPDLDFGASIPFELVGTSIFDDPVLDDLDSPDLEVFDDDLEF